MRDRWQTSDRIARSTCAPGSDVNSDPRDVSPQEKKTLKLLCPNTKTDKGLAHTSENST